MLSIEEFVITNFAMNLLVLGIGARSVGHINWRRVMTASLVGTVYATVAYTWFRPLRSFLAQTICLLSMTLILFAGRKGRKQWARGFLSIAGGGIFAGGVMTLLAGRMNAGGPLILAVGALIVAASAFLDGGIRRNTMEQTVLLRIGTRMGTTEVEAFVDTGNRLREPLSGLPVIIVSRQSLRGLLDESCLEWMGGRLPPGFRIVRYGALGGKGEMCCFRPESVRAAQGGRWMDGPDVWIAIYKGEIPSGVDALTPPIF